ncbi:MAG: site-specific DNA-methyltransferase [Burkholderiales bacterium]|nr:site-specific DNA-methyltransferase [Burkholderiales bacterium]
MNNYEQKFYTALSDLFVGAPVEGIGGFIKLMTFKHKYYKSIEQLLTSDIEQALEKHHPFREELFEKLYQFFSLYFTQNGCIYFNHTPFHNQIYDKVYNGKDVALFWKTNMLYYVKSEKLWRSLPIKYMGYDFYFDVSELAQKANNTKNGLIYQFKDVTITPEGNKQINFMVKLSSNGNKTKNEDILKTLSTKYINLSDQDINKLFAVFEKQNQVDYFINKDAKAFLTEQFKLWSYQYFWNGSDNWSDIRIEQLTILKNIANKVINFIAQFEDELVRIWNKPKFVRNSNYVVTLDKLVTKGLDISILTNHQGITAQIKEWQDLGMVNEDFIITDIIQSGDMFADSQYKYLPFDTKHFDDDIKYTILGLFDNLDDECDGVLIKSDNYQALNTIMPKYKAQVDLIYIDPPFNTGSDFAYLDNYQDSTWCSIMWDRLNLSKAIMSDKGSIYVHLDYRASHYNRMLMDSVFGVDNFRNEIIWHYQSGGRKEYSFSNKHDSIYLYAIHELNIFHADDIGELRGNTKRNNMKRVTDENGNSYYSIKANGKIYKYYEDEKITPPDVWLNISHLQQKDPERISYDTQKPEKLLERIIKASSNLNSLVCDFFAGSGTTLSVAHKLERKWLGVEMGVAFNTTYYDDEVQKIGNIGRMKLVLFGHKVGISKNQTVKLGGMFKYYELEQYEDTLAKSSYKDYELFDKQHPYSSYVFMADERLLETTTKIIDNQVKIDLTKLYPDIDIAESLSNLLGKKIAKLTKTQVTFTDDETIDLTNLELSMIKPFIWWG